MKFFIKSNKPIQAQQSLLLVVPIMSFGVIMATFITPGVVGKTIFSLTKIWLVLIPVLWRLKVEQKPIKLPKITPKQINHGLILGFLMFGAIVLSYWFLGQKLLHIDEVRNQANTIGITSLKIYFAGVLYWSFINSFIEECVWRGFIHRQTQNWIYSIARNKNRDRSEIEKPGLVATILAAIFFTLHHIIALSFYLNNILLVILASLGVFIAGVIWSAYYQKSGFWVCYISHILADLAIGLIGWHLLFYN